MPATFDIAVVGGGILGTFCAYHALHMGYTVALIERNHLPREATVRNFGQIVPSGLSRAWKGYGVRSLEIYRTLQSIGDFSIRGNGSYYLASDDDELLLIQELFEADQDFGYAPFLLSETQAREAIPGLKKSYCQGALYYPNELSVDPRTMIHSVITYLTEQSRLKYYPYTIAQEISTPESDVYEIKTNTKRFIRAHHVLFCGGAEYQLLFPDLHENAEISCVKIQMLLSKTQPTQRIPGNLLSGLSIRRYEAFTECPSFYGIQSKNDQDPRVAQWGIHILLKQADNGQIIIGDSHHYADAHQREDLGFDNDAEINQYIMDRVREMIALETYELASVWHGIYAQAKHQDIILKQPEPRIHVINAIGGKGMTAGPGFTHAYMEKHFGK